MTDLTAKQLAFCNLILEGKGPSEAYRLAGYSSSNPSVTKVRAQETLRSPKVAAFISKERAKLQQRAILTRERSLQILTNIAEEKEAPRRDKIAAVAQASRMQGFDAPERVTVKLEGSILWQIRNG